MSCHQYLCEEQRYQSCCCMGNQSISSLDIFKPDHIKFASPRRISQKKISLKKQSVTMSNINSASFQYYTQRSQQFANHNRQFIPEKKIPILPQKEPTLMRRPSYYNPVSSYSPNFLVSHQTVRPVQKNLIPKNVRIVLDLPKRLGKPKVNFTHNLTERNAMDHNKSFPTNFFPPPTQNKIPKAIKEQPRQKDQQEKVKQEKVEQSLKQEIKFSKEVSDPKTNHEVDEKLENLNLKKHNSLSSAKNTEENKYQSLFKSMRGGSNHHIHDMQCKKTESIADASRSSDELSEVVEGDQLRFKLRKMTSSEKYLKILEEDSRIFKKKSIIWQTSRKQSISQI